MSDATKEVSTAEISTDQPEVDPGEFRRVLGHFPTGVTVVTAAPESGPIGVAIGSFASISLDPPLVGFFLGTESSSGAAIQEAGHFCVNVLSHDQLELCGVMASRGDDKFAEVDWAAAPTTGAPMLPGVHAVIDCELERVVELGDHNLIVGQVQHLDTASDSPPMVFYRGNYGTFGSV